MRLRKLPLLEHVRLWHLIHDEVPVRLTLKIRDSQERGVRDEQDLSLLGIGVLEVPNDLGHDRGTVEVNITVQDSVGVRRVERLKFVLDRLVDEVLGRLDEEDLAAAARDPVGVPCERTRLARPARASK